VKQPIIRKYPSLNFELESLPASDKLPLQFKAPLLRVEEGTSTPEPEQALAWRATTLKLPLAKFHLNLNLTQISLRISRFNFSSELLLIPVLLVIYVSLLIMFKFSPEDKIVIDKLRKKLRGRKNKKEV
jgi:hypothetical protein